MFRHLSNPGWRQFCPRVRSRGVGLYFQRHWVIKAAGRTWLGQLWAWPVKAPLGSTASCSDIIFLGAGHFTQPPAAPWNLGHQFS